MTKKLLELDKPIIGMLHLKGNNAIDRLERVKCEIDIMTRNGVDALLVEDYFGNLTDVENTLKYLSKSNDELLYGVNVLHMYNNTEYSYETAYRIADYYGASFIQKDSIIGHLNELEELKYLAKLLNLQKKYDIPLLGGVRFKYQQVNSNRPVSQDLLIGARYCDAVVVTGEGTGKETNLEKIRQFKNVLMDFPVIIGSGLNPNNAYEQLLVADGAIVGSYFKENHIDSGDMSEENVKEFMGVVKTLRK